MGTRDTDVSMGSERSFGLTFAAVLTVLTGVRWFRHGSLPVVPLALAAAFLLAALALPRLLRPLNVVWFRFGLALNRVTSPLVFGLIYAVAVIPTAYAARLAGRQMLPRAIDRRRPAATYWIPRAAAADARGMVNQF